MKNIPYLFSLVTLILGGAMTLRHSKDIPWMIPAYLIGQSLLSAIGFFALQKMSTRDRAWMWFVALSLVFVLLFEAFTAVSFCWHLPLGWLIALFSFGLSLTVAVSFYRVLRITYLGKVPPALDLMLIQGLFLGFSGQLMLLTLVLHWPPAAKFSITALGFFWVALGTNFFGIAMNYFKYEAACIKVNNFVPAFLAIIAMAWLVFQLNGLQGETAREAVLAGVN